MITTAIFPGRYIQGGGALHLLGDEASRLGRQALVLCTRFAYDTLRPALLESLGGTLHCTFERFHGECCDEEVRRLQQAAEAQGADVIVGIGGGKTIDTAKLVARRVGARVVIVPTIASSDAPCSAVAVLYDRNGIFNRVEFLPHNPDIVLVDTHLIARAPVRYLVAGMGDALATWFEADDCHRKGAPNTTGRPGPRTAQILARLCYDLLRAHGVEALSSAEQHEVTPALEAIVEANTLLSGLGFESGGLAAAHSIHNGLTLLKPTHAYLHGEKVAVGLQAMLYLTGRGAEEIKEVFDFCASVGLPLTLEDIGITNVSDEDLEQVASGACAPGESIYNEPMEITVHKVVQALRAADAEGRRRK